MTTDPQTLSYSQSVQATILALSLAAGSKSEVRLDPVQCAQLLRYMNRLTLRSLRAEYRALKRLG